MIELIAQIGAPLLLPTYKSFEPGSIIKLVRTSSSIHCSLSENMNPFGMIISLPNSFGLVSVLYNTALIKTDLFDKECNYSIGNLLYSNNFGTLTSIKLQENSVPVGYVENRVNEFLLKFRWI